MSLVRAAPRARPSRRRSAALLLLNIAACSPAPGPAGSDGSTAAETSEPDTETTAAATTAAGPELDPACQAACAARADCAGQPALLEPCLEDLEALLGYANAASDACRDGISALCGCMNESVCEDMSLEPDCFSAQYGPLEASCAGRCIGSAGPLGDPTGWSCGAGFFCPDGAAYSVSCSSDYTCTCKADGAKVGSCALAGSCTWGEGDVPSIASSCCGV